MEFELDEGLLLKISKEPGEERGTCEAAATSGTAAMRGLCCLVTEVAERLGMTIEEVICRMAVIMLRQPEQTD